MIITKFICLLLLLLLDVVFSIAVPSELGTD